MIFSASQLAEGCGGVLMASGPDGMVGTDSRRIQPEQWFLALEGDRFDGHDFLPAAQRAECAGAIARRVPEEWTRGFVQVDDGLRALQNLARFVRQTFHGPVVGLTGSVGKTTTRALIGCALSGRIHQTQGNLNNHIGVPLTLLAAPVDATAWVVEMGMSGFGEIRLLAEIVQPTVRLITNVGAAHLEGVGSLDGVARAKGELFEGARPGDVCVINADDPRVAAIPIPDGVRHLCYGTQNHCDVRLTDASVDSTTLVTRFRVEVGATVVRGTLPSPGVHLAHNACAAIAVAVALHQPLDEVGARISGFEPVGARMRVEDGPLGIRVINDAYNANPMSMGASLRSLASVAGPRRVAVLGDMLELGEHAASAHAEVVAHGVSLGLDLVACAGPAFEAAAKQANLPWGIDASSLGKQLKMYLREGDLVLLKGSRGMAMERVLQELEGEG